MKYKLGLFVSLLLLLNMNAYAFTTTFYTPKFEQKNEALDAAFELKDTFHKNEEYQTWVMSQCDKPRQAYIYSSFITIVRRQEAKSILFIGQVTVEVRCNGGQA